MKRYLLKLQPDCFEDIIAMLALYRPGPLNSGMVDDFIKRKQGIQKIDYFHDDLKECLSPTYGVIVYQEQVMQIAQIIAGYSLVMLIYYDEQWVRKKWKRCPGSEKFS